MGSDLVEPSDTKSDILLSGQREFLRGTGVEKSRTRGARAISNSEPSQQSENRVFVAVSSGFSYISDPPTTTFPRKATHQTRLPETVSPMLSQEPPNEAELIKDIRRTLLDAKGVKYYER